MSRTGRALAAAWLGLFLTCAAADALQAQETVPGGTVIKVRLLDDLSSADARVGDRVRVRVAEDDRSGLPPGTVLVGRVTQVQKASRSQPGMIDVDFRVAELRNRWVPISGDPYSLGDRDVRETASGRLEAKGRRNERTKFIGYGAAGGVLLGKLLGTSTLEGVLLGAGAGYLYEKSRRNKSKYRDVSLDAGSEFGVRLNRRVALPRGAST